MSKEILKGILKGILKLTAVTSHLITGGIHFRWWWGGQACKKMQHVRSTLFLEHRQHAVCDKKATNHVNHGKYDGQKSEELAQWSGSR